MASGGQWFKTLLALHADERRSKGPGGAINYWLSLRSRFFRDNGGQMLVASERSKLTRFMDCSRFEWIVQPSEAQIICERGRNKFRCTVR